MNTLTHCRTLARLLREEAAAYDAVRVWSNANRPDPNAPHLYWQECFRLGGIREQAYQDRTTFCRDTMREDRSREWHDKLFGIALKFA